VTTTQVRRIDEIGEESRRRILDAAEELFAEKGFEKTSFVDIAARCGISRGSIPWHFKNKDGLLLAVVDRAHQRYLAREQFGDNPSLDAILSRYGELAKTSGGALLLVVLTEALTSSGAVREEYKTYHAEQRHRIATWLKFMGVRGAPTRESLATAITGAIMGIHLHWQVDPDHVDMDAAFRSLARMVMAHLEE
jgi:TetR/AcrR family acrAB operon transcriptional repressor